MMTHEMTKEVREELCRKLRAVVAERGQASLKGAVMIGMYDAENVSDIPYVTCPTISVETLGNVDYKTAREFENA